MERPVIFENQGQKLFGILHLPETGGLVPGVVLLHGFTGHKIEAHRLFVELARSLSAAGLAALRFDFRGSGDSEGAFQDMTVAGEVSDAMAAIHFLAAQEGVDASRLGMLGLSLGGCVAAIAVGKGAPVRSLVLWSAVGLLQETFAPFWTDEMANLMERQGWIDIGGLALGRAFVEEVKRLQPLQEIAKYNGPVLIVHGEKDESVDLKNARAYQRAIPGEKRLHIIPGADHVFSSLAWQEEAIRVTREWFVEKLL